MVIVFDEREGRVTCHMNTGRETELGCEFVKHVIERLE